MFNLLRRLVFRATMAIEPILPAQLRFPLFIKTYLPWIIQHPRVIPAIERFAKGYIQASNLRKLELKRGLQVPPFLIISITSMCNLNCVGCYAAAIGTVCPGSDRNSLGIDQWRSIIQQAKALGIFGFIIAGGEPFLKPGLLGLIEEFRDRLFVIFTNGTTLKNSDFDKLKELRNVIVVVSIEGNQELTDARRGNGIYQQILKSIRKLNQFGILNGISVTITRKNFKHWMNGKNIEKFISEGVHLGFFLEYIPVDNGPELMLTEIEHRKFRQTILAYRENKQILLIHSPGDEEFMGGCVSAGRGFAHITPSGDLTPCPVSNFATHNLAKTSLRAGLESPFFKLIRENEHLLETNGVPCALFAHPKELEVLMSQVCAYQTVGKIRFA